MPKKDLLKKLGMREEFDNWVKMKQTLLPQTFKDIKIGQTFEIVAGSPYLGWKGVVTSKTSGGIISTLTSPAGGEIRKDMITYAESIFPIGKHLRFI